MKAYEVLSFLVLTAIVTTTSHPTGNHHHDLSKREGHRIKKRSTTVFMDPADVNNYLTLPNTVVFMNNQRRHTKPSRKPSSWKMRPTPKVPLKVRKYTPSKPRGYGATRKTRTSKPTYRPKGKPGKLWTSKPFKKHNRKPIKTTMHKYHDQKTTFAEPPLRNHHEPTFGEPPHHTLTSSATTTKVSFQPLRGQEFLPPQLSSNLYRTRDANKYPMDYFNYPQYQYDEDSQYDVNLPKGISFDDEEAAFGKEFKKQPKDNIEDSTAEFTQPHPVFATPQTSPSAIKEIDMGKNYFSFIKPVPEKYIQKELEEEPKEHHRPTVYQYRNKYVSQKLKNLKGFDELNDEPYNQLFVGGKYAEPPPRIAFKDKESPIFNNQVISPMFDGHQSSVFSFTDEDDDFRLQSASMSPYVNYKNSNMAFSPQNLNDAFGIVDKK